MSHHRFFLLAAAVLLCSATFCPADDANVVPIVNPPQTSDQDTPGASAKLLDDVRTQVARGRAQLDANQIASVDTLRNAAQKSLGMLVQFIGSGVLTAPPEEMPTTGFLAAAVRQAADVHFWWGRAADQFGRRDEALAAYARAVRFAGQLRGGSNALARDSLLALGGVLRDGLPQLAPDDTLDTIADVAHGKLWKPLRFAADFSNANFTLRPNETLAAPDLFRREFLITHGRLYPPVPSSAVDVNAALSRVPPLYRLVDADALPQVLRHDRMAVGYEREVAGANKGLWRQVVRVFYASTYLTKDRRDDAARAEALCAQFLKVHALTRLGLGLDNPYIRDGVTTLWLSEVSSWWPKDDDDPRVREAIGPQMPKTNVPIAGQSTPSEIESPPTSYPWRAAAQIDSAPGEIMFFKIGQKRDEAEWLREMMHEYGHVVLPPLDNFKPPLEPYGNGVLGETLGMMWGAADPSAWGLPVSVNGAGEATLPAALREHARQNALASLNFWKNKGPVSPLRRDGTAQGLQYLQGLTTYIERVYGAPILGRAFAPLIEKSVSATDPLARLNALNTDSLMTSFPNALRDLLGSSVTGTEIRIASGSPAKRVLPVWLGGALESPSQTVDELISRAPLKLRSGQKASGWLYVPSAAGVLRVEWQSGSHATDALQIEGISLLVPATPANRDASGAAIVDVRSRPGWQRFNFVARVDLTILSAQFENAPR